MNPATNSRLVSKFAATYDRLFDGYTPQEISPHESPSQFWSNLLSLNVDRTYLGQKFRKLDKDTLLSHYKPFLNTLFSTCLYYLRTVQFGDSKKRNAAETLSILVRCTLEKDLLGWEVMDMFAGGVGESDAVFLSFVETIEQILKDESAPVELRHQVLQLSVVFACGISQLSPGAYLLRRNFFPALVSIMKSPKTQAFTFEASLLLSIVANFHRTDAAKLNPYLRSIKETQDKEMLKSISYSANFTMDTVIKAYQEISDDSPPTFASSMSSLLASFRPDRALSSTPVDAPKELFKNQPIEAAVILLPVHDFLHLNITFNAVLLEPFISDTTTPSSSSDPSADLPPLLYTLLTLSSYILTHASSAQSPRAMAYANLCLVTLLHLVENDVAMSSLLQPRLQGKAGSVVRLCRQAAFSPDRLEFASTIVCFAGLLCAVAEAQSSQTSRGAILYHLHLDITPHDLVSEQNETTTRQYHWEELWRSLVSLLDFLSSKLTSSGKVEQLAQETITLFIFSLQHAESYLGTPQAVHQLIYELIRSSSILRKQQAFCESPPSTFKSGRRSLNPSLALRQVLGTVNYYEKKIQDIGASLTSASAVLKVIAKEVERDGLFGAKESNEDDAPTHSDDLGEVGFVRFACTDGLALMPGPD